MGGHINIRRFQLFGAYCAKSYWSWAACSFGYYTTTNWRSRHRLWIIRWVELSSWFNSRCVVRVGTLTSGLALRQIASIVSHVPRNSWVASGRQGAGRNWVAIVWNRSEQEELLGTKGAAQGHVDEVKTNPFCQHTALLYYCLSSAQIRIRDLAIYPLTGIITISGATDQLATHTDTATRSFERFP